MTTTAGQFALALYAVLLAAGGVAGYAKARSLRSLVAGLGCAVVALVALLLTFATPAGFYLGDVLAAALLLFFGARFLKGRKFMPAGLMVVASLAVLAALLALGLRGPAASP